jgi:hypothetical protein
MEIIICWLKNMIEWLASHNEIITAIATVFMAIATVFMAVFTWRLWVSTNRLWEEAKNSAVTASTAANAAKDNAIAAKDSVLALKASERAYVFAEVHLEELFFGSNADVGRVEARIQFWNYGKTPAIIELVGADLTIQKQLPAVRSDSEDVNRPLPPSLAIGTNDSYPIYVNRRISLVERNEIGNLNTNLFCVGIIKYSNVHNEPCETEFCWNLFTHGGDNKFVVTRDSTLNRRT